jgi:hypothetical protein
LATADLPTATNHTGLQTQGGGSYNALQVTAGAKIYLARQLDPPAAAARGLSQAVGGPRLTYRGGAGREGSLRSTGESKDLPSSAARSACGRRAGSSVKRSGGAKVDLSGAAQEGSGCWRGSSGVARCSMIYDLRSVCLGVVYSIYIYI